MAKLKGSFGVKVSGGNAAGFSNIPGAGSYTVTLGKQFGKKFSEGVKSVKKKPKGVGGEPAPTQDTPTAQVDEPIKPSKPKPAKGETGKIGTIKVKPGSNQVSTQFKTVTVDDIKAGKHQPPIRPENIPSAYKPEGPAPSERNWSAEEKLALESERPKSYVDPGFKAEPDTPENVSRRRAELMEGMSTKKPSQPKAKKPETSSKSKSSAGFSPSDTSALPPVKLE